MTLEQLPLIMLRALALTILIECAAAWLLGARTKRDQTTVVLVNLLTNPLVVSLGAATSLWLGFKAVRPVTLAMEVLVVVIEGAVYKKTLIIEKNPYVVSLVCNLASFLIGEVLNRYVF